MENDVSSVEIAFYCARLRPEAGKLSPAARGCILIPSQLVIYIYIQVYTYIYYIHIYSHGVYTIEGSILKGNK